MPCQKNPGKSEASRIHPEAGNPRQQRDEPIKGPRGLEPRRPARAARPPLPPEGAGRTSEFLRSRPLSPLQGSARLTLQLQVPLPQLGVPLLDLLPQEFHL